MTRAALGSALLGTFAATVVFAQQPPQLGAPLDPASFAFQRSIPDGRPGAVALVADPFTLAHSRGPAERFADVRILDGSDRQVPYVVEFRDEMLVVPLTLERAELPVNSPGTSKRSNWSSYRLTLPCANLPGLKIAIETSAQVFQRSVQVAAVRPADRQSRDARLEILTTTSWEHVSAEQPARPLTMSVAPGDTSELWLSVDEGDNSPLPITAARLLLPSYRFRFYRPARSSLTLVYGRGDLPAPRYDLALVSNTLLRAEAVEVTPRAERQTKSPRASFVSPAQFWILLSIAVVVLLLIVVRLTKRRGA